MKNLITIIFLIVANQSLLQAQSAGVDSTRIMRPMSEIVRQQTEQAQKEWLKLWYEGPTETTWSNMPLQEGDKAPDFELETSNNKLVKISDLWKDQPVLLVFWRHTGCGCGFMRADSIRKSYDDIVKKGVKVVMVTQAEPERAAFYKKEQNIKGTLLSDTNYQVYRAFGLLDGGASQILGTPEIDFSIGEQLQNERIGTQRALVDNPWLLPGEFIINTSGIIQFVYRYGYCNDIPEYWQLEVELDAVVSKK
jgi:peroxiredoxin